MSQRIKAILDTPGWKEIKQYFQEESDKSLNTSSIKESNTAEHIKLEVMARNKVASIIIRVLKRIDKIENASKPIPRVSYR